MEREGEGPTVEKREREAFGAIGREGVWVRRGERGREGSGSGAEREWKGAGGKTGEGSVLSKGIREPKEGMRLEVDDVEPASKEVERGPGAFSKGGNGEGALRAQLPSIACGPFHT